VAEKEGMHEGAEGRKGKGREEETVGEDPTWRSRDRVSKKSQDEWMKKHKEEKKKKKQRIKGTKRKRGERP